MPAGRNRAFIAVYSVFLLPGVAGRCRGTATHERKAGRGNCRLQFRSCRILLLSLSLSLSLSIECYRGKGNSEKLAG